MQAAMNDCYGHPPDRFNIEPSVIAALAVPHGPNFSAWVGDVRNLSVIEFIKLEELRMTGDQKQSVNVILLEQGAASASVPRSKELPNEIGDEDVHATADLLRPVYDVSDGRAGFVSFALPPPVGNDARGVAEAARQIWHRARRPNLLVQIPATPAGIRAVFRLTTEAVCVHVTPLASYVVYRDVAEAYSAGLRHRAECGLPISGIASFATLPALGFERELDGVAEAYHDNFSETAFRDLRRLGGRSQILLRRPMRDTSSRLRLAVALRSDDGRAYDGALGAVASSSGKEA